MLSKFPLLRPPSVSLHCFLPPPTHFPPNLLRRTASLPLRSAAKTTDSSQFSFPDTKSDLRAYFAYGPSLDKGTQPYQGHLSDDADAEAGNNFLNEHRFTRVFEISALRVPADLCSALESRLRGHLLNWPRVRNIARVPGDEMDDETMELLKLENDVRDEDEVVKLLSRRIYGRAEGDGGELSGVLYRDKLAREFNARGFVKFRNLAKISRPKRRRRDKGKEKAKGVPSRVKVETRIVGRKGAVVEEDLSGLLGEEFKGRKWRGSTRLLLLDERFAGKEVDELPEAIKEVFKGAYSQGQASVFEFVRCRLTLFYDYWPMNEVLEALLPKGMIVPCAFETVGHIAHLNLREEHLPYKKLIAKVVLDKNKPKIQTVVNKVDAITSDFRTMQLEILAGNHSLVTTVVENGLRFHVNLGTVYWNSRLGSERQRLVSYFTGDDVVCDVFAGVGPIAIAAAERVKRVYANDLNPCAVDYLQRNCVLNKLERKIEVFNMDGRRFIDALFSSAKAHSITQVVMNLPNDGTEFLGAFRGIFGRDRSYGKKRVLPVIHVYGFSKADDPEFEFHERISIALLEVAVDVEMHRVRQVAPGKWMLCASFVLPESVACGKPVCD
ncbi:hypothetical protein Dimus_012737 [Dionaea muscipula]